MVFPLFRFLIYFRGVNTGEGGEFRENYLPKNHENLADNGKSGFLHRKRSTFSIFEIPDFIFSKRMFFGFYTQE